MADPRGWIDRDGTQQSDDEGARERSGVEGRVGGRHVCLVTGSSALSTLIDRLQQPLVLTKSLESSILGVKRYPGELWYRRCGGRRNDRR